MSQDAEAQELVRRARSGDEEAAAELFNRFSRRLVLLADSRLNHLLRGRVDAEDIVQSAFRSFFERLAAGQFKLDEWENIWGLLVRITLRKCGHKLEQFRAQRRDAARETPLPDPTDDSADCWQPIARHPTPLEALMLAEIVESLLAGFSKREQEIVALRLQGYTKRKISSTVGRSERTVSRVLERLRRRAERLYEEFEE